MDKDLEMFLKIENSSIFHIFVVEIIMILSFSEQSFQ